jgi:hypothetical protein
MSVVSEWAILAVAHPAGVVLEAVAVPGELAVEPVDWPGPSPDGET